MHNRMAELWFPPVCKNESPESGAKVEKSMKTSNRASLCALCAVVGIAWFNSLAMAETLQYGKEQGQKFTYDFDIEADAPGQITKYKGTTEYTVDSMSNEQIRVTFQGGLQQTVKTKGSSSSFPQIPIGPIFSPGFGSPFANANFMGRNQTRNRITMTRRGRVLAMEGDSQLPFLLGNLSLLPFEPLPDTDEEKWTVDFGVSINSSEGPIKRFGFFAPFGSFAGPFADREPKRIQTASEVAEYSIQSKGDQQIVVKKTYKLQTGETLDKEAFEITGEGSWTFNVKECVPEAMDMRLKVQRKEDNVSVTIPITLKFQRVPPEELEKRAAVAKQKAAEAKELAERPLTQAEKQELLVALSSSAPFDLKNALDKLALKTVAESDPEIVNAIQKLLKNESQMVVDSAERSLAKWSPSFKKKYEINKLYKGPLHVPSTDKPVDSSTPLFVGQIVQAQEFGNVWQSVKVQRLQNDGKVEVGLLMAGRVIRSMVLARRSIQLAPDEVEQPDRANELEIKRDVREWEDRTGKFKLQASFVKLVDGTVYLKTNDAKEIKVPLERLSNADRDYVKLAEENAENPFLP